MEKIITEEKIYTNNKHNCWFTEDFLKSYAEQELSQPLTKELLNAWELKPVEHSSMDIHIPEACRNCSNHPSNGGSGICHCILGNTSITY